jgi:hypothetical protein
LFLEKQTENTQAIFCVEKKMESIEVEYLAADELKAIELAMAQAEASHARASPTSRSTAPQPQQPRQPTTSAAQLPVGLPDYLDYDLDIIFVLSSPPPRPSLSFFF